MMGSEWGINVGIPSSMPCSAFDDGSQDSALLKDLAMEGLHSFLGDDGSGVVKNTVINSD